MTNGIERVEAPVTWKAYMACAFAAFGGIFFGFDSGYISGVLAMDYVKEHFRPKSSGPYPTDPNAPDKAKDLPSWVRSLITSILSAGTFFGALVAGDLADYFGRRITIIAGCGVFIVGIILQTASTGWQLLVAGRAIAGIGVGFVSAIIILYMSEIAPRKVRGALVSGYQFCITIGLLLASCVDYGTKDRNDTGSYRIPIAIQFLWALILGGGIAMLPESPRWYVKRGRPDDAAKALSRIRGQPINSDYIREEVAEIVANYEYERSLMPTDSYWAGWAYCFKGGLGRSNSNLRLTILGTSIQMMQQWTGINFIFYYGTEFFKNLGTISNPFLISLITTLVNVCTTPISFYTIERYGRRALLIYGAIGMTICEFIVAIMGVAKPAVVDPITNVARPEDKPIASAQIAFICIYIAFFATTWGPGAWVVIGEIFPIPIRARGVALSTASNWLWNCIIAVITPYMVDRDKGNLGSKVFFIWGSLCATCVVYAYFMVWETKGLTLEQVDQMMEEVRVPWRSKGWKPSTTFAAHGHDAIDQKVDGEKLDHPQEAYPVANQAPMGGAAGGV
ncbi:hypothetical protein A1Q1_03574 [Trichosporon asahii var. asahii CBS 2479]|uniref:Major facilitator superfamily (MFS) profile domain-containing protein n=1 Tax=Trichosporon asahii var. asahii (strain ATCC 90039 / CBS 2479 / JCM 2466 / KCTC 7840 / NBRC 103889/ NCYC 2677 / UAMH 7654) TaxID=1186058 RepID=J5QIT9_TRIAS|nr:hypothetical protein A1Q1_03574 [Trichosporon asahii var. asahii CBS 2479]EJT47553.1 hypothetical protein A1Q1_03574 [Trichosporon asahii var. asahii CBS 2479]